MNNLVFATNNQNKINEVRAVLPPAVIVLGLKDISCYEELPENQNTLEGNALEKAGYVYDNFGFDCFSEDTGLEVRALNNAPGVYSARYAGLQKNADDNINKVLEKLHGNKDRTARFRTVIALIIKGKRKLFEGIVEGEILIKREGVNGFGYDPVFKPNGYEYSFGVLDQKIKLEISHRSRAVSKLLNYLNSLI